MQVLTNRLQRHVATRPEHKVHAGRPYLGSQGVPTPSGLPLATWLTRAGAWDHQQHSSSSSAGALSTRGSGHRGGDMSTHAVQVASRVSTSPSSTSVPTPAPADPNPDIDPNFKPDLGYPRDLEEEYEWGEQVGKGGNGVVRLVKEKSTGIQFACKSIPKVLGPEATERKRKTHLDSLKREIGVLRKLKGCLNIVDFKAVYEDDDSVYILQEFCQGGELCQRIGSSHYSERTVASFLRAALRTLAVMHSHHVMHRDIKPENFMFLNNSPRSPLKAIDFGLAVPYEPDQLPRTDLGLEGTPWYMAPETLSSQVYPSSDIWQVGVMAYQLLTGRLPFDDWKSKGQGPDVKQIWRSILIDEVDVDSKYFVGISAGAKDFVLSLLNRDHKKRPTAKEALKHPWIQGNSAERLAGKELDKSVVQRIQRFAQASEFKRIVLEHLTTDMLANPWDPNAAAVCRLDETGRPVVDVPQSVCFQALMDKFKEEDEEHRDELCRNKFQEALKSIGFNLDDSEVARLMSQLGQVGGISRSTFLASQLDWSTLQKDHSNAWYDMVERTFKALDSNGDGFITKADILRTLDERLPPEELQSAVEHVMEEAGIGMNSEALDLEDFLHMLRTGSTDSLDMYDDRINMLSSYDSSSSLSSSDSSTGKLRRETTTAAMLNPGLKALLGEDSTDASSAPKPNAQKVDFHFDNHTPAPTKADPPTEKPNFRFSVEHHDKPDDAAKGMLSPLEEAQHSDVRVKGSNLYQNAVMKGGGGDRWF